MLNLKIDLAKGLFTVHFAGRQDTSIKFHLTSDEAAKIADKYYELGINAITGVNKEFGTIFIEDNCMIFPQLYTIIHIKAEKKSQDIQIDTSCDDFSLSNVKKAKSVKLFLDFIWPILKRKPEIENAPRSNAIYICKKF